MNQTLGEISTSNEIAAPNRPAIPGINLVSLIVRTYDEAIEFFTQKLGFELVEDSPSLTNAGTAKRWVVIRPPSLPQGTRAGCNILLAQADGVLQDSMIGNQFAGRVGIFWNVNNFEVTYARLQLAGIEFLTEPKNESYGRYAVFFDLMGNKWDLIGPVP